MGTFYFLYLFFVWVERGNVSPFVLKVVNLLEQVSHYPLEPALLCINQRLLLEQRLLLPVRVELVEELLAEGHRRRLVNRLQNDLHKLKVEVESDSPSITSVQHLIRMLVLPADRLLNVPDGFWVVVLSPVEHRNGV